MEVMHVKKWKHSQNVFARVEYSHFFVGASCAEVTYAKKWKHSQNVHVCKCERVRVC